MKVVFVLLVLAGKSPNKKGETEKAVTEILKVYKLKRK
jgi:hypothetical protein